MFAVWPYLLARSAYLIVGVNFYLCILSVVLYGTFFRKALQQPALPTQPPPVPVPAKSPEPDATALSPTSKRGARFSTASMSPGHAASSSAAHSRSPTGAA